MATRPLVGVSVASQLTGRARPQAVFLDRDGVINVRRDDYVKTPAELQMLPAAAKAVAALTAAHIPVFVITNQSAIGRGLMTESDLAAIHRAMLDILAEHGGRIAGVFHCPHRPWDGCECRKPRPGLLLCAAAEHDLDLSRCLMIGDSESDVLAGQAAGCQAIRVGSPPEPDLLTVVRALLGSRSERER